MYFPPLVSVLETIKNIGYDFKQEKKPKAWNSSAGPISPLLPLPAEQTKPVSLRRTSGHGNFSPNSYSLAWLQAVESRILCEVAGNLNNRLCGSTAVHREICIMCKSLRYLLLQVSYPRFHTYNCKHLLPDWDLLETIFDSAKSPRSAMSVHLAQLPNA